MNIEQLVELLSGLKDIEPFAEIRFFEANGNDFSKMITHRDENNRVSIYIL
jgi:hypothetical protein